MTSAGLGGEGDCERTESGEDGGEDGCGCGAAMIAILSRRKGSIAGSGSGDKGEGVGKAKDKDPRQKSMRRYRWYYIISWLEHSTAYVSFAESDMLLVFLSLQSLFFFSFFFRDNDTSLVGLCCRISEWMGLKQG